MALCLYFHLQRVSGGALLWMAMLVNCLLSLIHRDTHIPAWRVQFLFKWLSYQSAYIHTIHTIHVVSICAQRTNVSSDGTHCQNGNKKAMAIVLGSVPQLGVVLRLPQGATGRLRTDWGSCKKRKSGDHEGGVGRAPDQCGSE